MISVKIVNCRIKNEEGADSSIIFFLNLQTKTTNEWDIIEGTLRCNVTNFGDFVKQDSEKGSHPLPFPPFQPWRPSDVGLVAN